MEENKKRKSEKVATHEGILKIGETDFNVAVLKDGTRLLTGRSILSMMDRPYKGQYQDELPAFVRGKNLEAYISPDVRKMLKPIPFKTINGKNAKGFKAELLPEICDIYLTANKEGKLASSQISVAHKCEIIIKSLAKIGIIGLIDEATGYQDVRDRQALQKILEMYIRDEYAKWSKRFPDEFYRELFRLRNWSYRATTSKRPQCIGRITNDIIYSRLPPGVLEDLKRKNPSTGKGQRKHKHHQFLTEKIGIPELDRHLYATMGFMRSASSWDVFIKRFNQAFPKVGVPTQLDLFMDDQDD